MFNRRLEEKIEYLQKKVSKLEDDVRFYRYSGVYRMPYQEKVCDWLPRILDLLDAEGFQYKHGGHWVKKEEE